MYTFAIARSAAALAIVLALGATSDVRASGAHDGHVSIEPDKIEWRDGPGSLPPGARFAVLTGDPSKAEPITLRLKLPAGYTVPPHTHPAIEHITVLEGRFHIAAGETLDKSEGMSFPAGGFVVMPAGQPHYAWVEEGTVVQLHSNGPWGITYLDPADDPRKSN
jgi:hypothetical protein